ncbi:MAG: ornithine cyclodeaminase family protein [Synergistota bacterium]|nr:ornithine cyclodeaminase family protein [Synergistota bacterium]
MLVISGDEIRSLYPMKDAIEATKRAFTLFSQGKTDVPLRTQLPVREHDGTVLFMPAYVSGDRPAAGVKIVSVFPGNPSRGLPAVPSTVVLVDAETGMPKALLNGTVMTQVRTGAAAGAATDLLAREDSKIGALFGAGGQAECQLEAIITARPLEEVRVFDPRIEQSRALVERLGDRAPFSRVRLLAAETPEQALKDADVVTTVTTAKKPVFDASLLKPGAHVNGVGSFTPEMQELDPVLLGRAGKIYMDSVEAVLAESADFINPINEKTFSRDRITGELGELAAGKKPGRQSDEEITLFKTVGIAVQDVVVAEDIFDRVAAQKAGRKIEL